MSQLYLVIALLFAVAVAVFAVQNATPVQVNFLRWHFESSLVVVILISAALGALLTVLLGVPRVLRIRRRLKEESTRLMELEQRLKEQGGEAPPGPAERGPEGK